MESKSQLHHDYVSPSSLGIALLFILALTALCIFNPFNPVMPSSIPLDPSWVIGLNQAVAQQLKFGQDLIFTFGPYAAVYTKAFHPGTVHLEILGSLFLGLLYVLALLLVLKRSQPWVVLCLILLLAGFTAHLDSIFYSYALLAAIYCWQTVSNSTSFTSKNWASLVCIALLFSGFGLYPLIKGPHFVLYFPIAILSIGLFLWFRKWLTAIIVPISIALSMTVFWVYAKQDLSTLTNYFYSLSLLISGFAPAMSSVGNAWEVITYIGAACLILVYILLRGGIQAKTLYLFLAFSLYLFVAFKAGFVRHDGHALMSGNALILAALLMMAILPSRAALILLGISSLVFFNIEYHYQPIGPQKLAQKIQSTYTNTWNGLQSQIKYPERTNTQFNQTLAELAKSNPLPKLTGTSDIYPFDQTYLIASGNSWNPRPIFQSYHAYTQSLAELNRAFLMKSNAPDYLFFRIESIDERLPSADDGSSWQILLNRYRPNGWAGKYIVLQKSNTENKPDTLVNISTATYPVIDWVELPRTQQLLYASIDIKPSWLGKLKSMVYKSSPLGIAVRLDDGSVKQFRLIPGNVSSNFLLSPLIENTEEFSQLYGDIQNLKKKRVQAISIWAEGSPRDWQKTYQLTLKSGQ
jgi:hypothetical protein